MASGDDPTAASVRFTWGDEHLQTTNDAEHRLNNAISSARYRHTYITEGWYVTPTSPKGGTSHLHQLVLVRHIYITN